MCGIAGEYSFSEKADKEALCQMMQGLLHRGPDEEGSFIKENVGLGFRRLSIIDLKTGNQPIFNEDRKLCIVFNGEIYNYRELKTMLEKHKFRTATDTEVILHLFEEYGPDAFGKLNGMFALAIYDIEKNVLYCARDRFGQKPLNYYCDSKRYVFASEIQALRRHKAVNAEFDQSSLAYYLFYNYIPAPHSAFLGIKKLPPQSYMIIDSHGIKITRYNLSTQKNIETHGNQLEIIDHTKSLIKKAVERHMIADVEVGIFLSGGIDSTIILKYAKEIKPDIKAFSVTFNPYISEYQYIEKACDVYGLTPFLIDIKPDYDKIVKIISSYSEPFGDSAIIPTYMISQYARENVKAVLTGEGGDEVFGGYDRYQRLVDDQKPKSNGQFKSHYLSEITYCPIDHLRSNYGVDAASLARHLDGIDLHSVTEAIEHEKNQRLPDNHFQKVDIASMANSLEARCPFLDHELNDFVTSIPIKYKVTPTGGKIIPKIILEKEFQQDFIERPKWGFGAPVSQWMLEKNIKRKMAVLLEEEGRNFNLILKKEQAQKIKQDFCVDNGHPLNYEHWKIFVLLAWLRENRVQL